ncbi:nitrilase and fragile histidine triad fusion protein NitFhit isoform X2 [Procambarus clarkii]|uniref:nitrilase and fragile histidine triad fusion protein NitFhit isoform X2 n=1 Tax=Procambarus clarkii TaxID=6728 RepID=UPI003741F16A
MAFVYKSPEEADVNPCVAVGLLNLAWYSNTSIAVEEGEDKLHNTHIVIDDKGKIVSIYSKVHLFSVHIPERNLHLEEKGYVCSGKSIRPPVSTPVGEVALSICYDMRFPEMSLIQRKLGAQILTFPSAFTVPTGLAHWEPLLRVRAIETQCYVIAAAQTGQHNKNRSSYGHAMVVDPWGAVVCQVSDGTGFALADINLNFLQKIRQEMPVLSHRRLDLYHVLDAQLPDCPRICDLLPFPSPYLSYQFGKVSVPGSCVFLKSQLSQAFVNKKPVVPGHILLTPERPASRLHNLQVSEISDLAQLAQKAVEIIMCHYQVKACNIAIQDGPAAGQTIDHVHIHIVPQSTALKQKLQGHEGEGVRQERAMLEMEEEAGQLRQVATQILSSYYNAVPGIPCNTCVEIPEPECFETFQFGSVEIPNSCLIVKTKHSCAFVAPNPVLPGHVYVTLLKPSAGFRRTSAEQITDLFIVMHSIQHAVETSQKTESSTIVLLEDSDLSQEDQHLQVHAHIIPRTEGDLENNDDIYNSILQHYGENSKWKFSQEVMTRASQLRSSWLMLNYTCKMN